MFLNDVLNSSFFTKIRQPCQPYGGTIPLTKKKKKKRTGGKKIACYVLYLKIINTFLKNEYMHLIAVKFK